MNWHSRMVASALVLTAGLVATRGQASAETLVGFVEPVTPLGQYMALEMTIGDTHTLFKMTGPDYSWFAFGFDTQTMQGYSLIVEGVDDARTAVEQNLVNTGIPGSPQATQNIEILSTTHDAANDLTTILIRRPNMTGDPEDPDFPHPTNPLPIIWSYGSFSSPEFPSPDLSYHGSNGRGDTFITFEPVAIPEPSTMALLGLAGALLAMRRRGG